MKRLIFTMIVCLMASLATMAQQRYKLNSVPIEDDPYPMMFTLIKQNDGGWDFVISEVSLNDFIEKHDDIIYACRLESSVEIIIPERMHTRYIKGGRYYVDSYYRVKDIKMFAEYGYKMILRGDRGIIPNENFNKNLRKLYESQK